MVQSTNRPVGLLIEIKKWGDFMDKKVCIITGANAGIGKATAIQMLQAGYYVIMACRSQARGEEALVEIKEKSKCQSVELMLLDLSLQSSTRAFAEKIIEKFDKVDVLIHNAAIFDIAQKEVEYTKEGYETVWMTNHVNPVYLTDLLLNTIKASNDGRIITVASKGLLAMPLLKVDLEDPEFRNRKFTMTKAYYQSKRAQVMFTYALAKKLQNTNITVNCIRVPAVKIDITRHPNISGFTKWIYKQKSKQSITPEQMARIYVYLATSDEVKKVTGKFFDEKNQMVPSNQYTKKESNIKKVMVLTQQYIEDPLHF